MIKQLIEAGTLKQIAEGDEQEKTKIGKLRGGSCGMIREDGTIIGACAAEAYARFKGVNGSQVDISKELMFAGGRANETLWLDSLQRAYDGPILCEEDIPLVWVTESGVSVTGRPDIVLCDKTRSGPSPVCLVELKQIMSSYSAYHVGVKNTPMLKHVIQAAWYTYQLKCNGELWYTSRQNITCDAWMDHNPRFPAPGEPGSERFSYRYYRLGKTNARSGKPTNHKSTEAEYWTLSDKVRKAVPKSFVPFLQGYLLDIADDGNVYIQDAMIDNSQWLQTTVNINDIKRWYNYLAELENKSKVMPPLYRNVDIWGEDTGFKFESQFGPELDPAKWVGKSLTEWFDQVKLKMNKG